MNVQIKTVNISKVNYENKSIVRLKNVHNYFGFIDRQ